MLVLALAACQHPKPAAGDPKQAPPIYAVTPVQEAFLDTLQERTFRYFWKTTDPVTGLTPDRAPTPSFCSIAAVGFALTAYPIGVERHSIQRWQAVKRVKNTLRFFLHSKQGPEASGATGYHGFYYHFLDMKTGTRFKDIELSTMDTALLMGGVLLCQSYFNREEPDEIEIRAMAESLYARVEWDWAQTRPPFISHGWTPEQGFLPYDWRGMNESQIVELLALGSPTHPVKKDSYLAWLETCKWGKYYDQEHIGFAPLFGHQYTQVWYDLAGLQDSLMAAHGIDWFENSRRATLAQVAYAKDNPAKYRGYGENFWGLTACDGPMDGKLTIEGSEREFHTYEARGASFVRVGDDGTVAPTAAGGSMPFAPEIVIPTLMAMRHDYGENGFSKYGFVDAINPTLNLPGAKVSAGQIVPGLGWFDIDYLGIDEGPILAMCENFRTGLVWKYMHRNPHVIQGLRAAGFSGGWLDRTEVRQ